MNDLNFKIPDLSGIPKFCPYGYIIVNGVRVCRKFPKCPPGTIPSGTRCKPIKYYPIPKFPPIPPIKFPEINTNIPTTYA